MAAGVIQVASDPASTIPTIGASGTIAGVMGGAIFSIAQGKGRCFVYLCDFLSDILNPADVCFGV